MAQKHRAAVIGRTGRGGYGHGLDIVYLDMEDVEIVAVADDDPDGLKAAGERLGVRSLYRDYREMLEHEKPDIVSVCPRWIGCHHPMVLACAEAGASSFLEKPMAPTLKEADEMIEGCQARGVKLAIAHQARGLHHMQRLVSMVRDGLIGELQLMRGRGKEDQRGGGEDLMVLGTHIMDMMRMFAGDPSWVFGYVNHAGGREIAPEDVTEGPEEIGLIAGDEINGFYSLEGGVKAHFESRRHQKGPRMGLELYGSDGIISVRGSMYREVYLCRQPVLRPAESPEWTSLAEELGVGLPSASPSQLGRSAVSGDLGNLGNLAIVRDLVAAIEEDREPISSGADGRAALEMILGIYESHICGRWVKLPLENREHPLLRLRRETGSGAEALSR